MHFSWKNVIFFIKLYSKSLRTNAITYLKGFICIRFYFLHTIVLRFLIKIEIVSHRTYGNIFLIHTYIHVFANKKKTTWQIFIKMLIKQKKALYVFGFSLNYIASLKCDIMHA